MNSAIALVSGGLDSIVALAVAKEQLNIPLAIFFDYGQLAAVNEEKAAKRLCEWADVPLQRITLPWLGSILPVGVSPETGTPDTQQTLDDVWVPNRNGVFVNIAAAMAEHHGYHHVILGSNSTEGETFTDNAPGFTKAVNQSLSFSTRSDITVITPLVQLNKAQILQQANELHVPLQDVWSCYNNGKMACGQCMSCKHYITVTA
jgi:7-cyano-7-deazaguanine synthase